MSFRSDISVDWSVTPRIITVGSPSTDLSVQDLIDTCRELEQEMPNLVYPHLINASGKEPLGSGVSVGVTAELRNAVVAFEPRLVSSVSGTASSADPDGEILEDAGATFISSSIVAGDSITNIADGSVSSIKEVISETQVRVFGLQDGSDNQWEVGDTYKIWNKIQCEVNGGNLVAVDYSGTPISAFLPTKNTYVVRTSSSSATLQDIEAIQYASYGGGVHIEASSPYAGIDYPVGTEEFPVNNLTDAEEIAQTRGFVKFFIRGDYTITTENVSEGYIFEGQSLTLTTIHIESAANVANCEFDNARITGTLDGGNTLRGCIADGINYVNGSLQNCGLHGTIHLDGGSEAKFINCYSDESSVVHPVIDMGGSGQSLLVRNYSGGLDLENKTGLDSVSIDFATGEIIIANTVIAGDIFIRGLCRIENNAPANVNVDTSGVLFTDQLQLNAFESHVSIDISNGETGTRFPTGTRQHPVNNLADAKIIAASRGINQFYVKDLLTIGAGEDISGLVFQGTDNFGNGVVMAPGCITQGTTFYDLNLSGEFNGVFNAQRCNVRDVSNVGDTNGISCFYECRLIETPTLTLSSDPNPLGGSIHFINCTTGVETGDVIFDLNNTNFDIAVRNFSGHIDMKNHNTPTTIELSFAQGRVIFEPTCSSGEVSVRGICEIIDNSTGTFTVDKRAAVGLTDLTPSSIASLEELIKGNVDGLDYRQVASALLAVLAGKMVITSNGPKDDTVEFKAQDDVTTYVTGRVVDGIRTESDVNEENM
jgi:hypothetical protein